MPAAPPWPRAQGGGDKQGQARPPLAPPGVHTLSCLSQRHLTVASGCPAAVGASACLSGWYPSPSWGADLSFQLSLHLSTAFPTPCTRPSPKAVPPSALRPHALGCTSGAWRSCTRCQSPRALGVSSFRGTPIWCCTWGLRSEPTCTSGLEGGVDSAFKSARCSTGPGPVRRLYQVKGRRNIRATERDLSWASFNTGDCFILDLGETIFTWCGARSNVLERSRAQELAAAIRDSERGGKACLEMVVDGEEPPEMLQVLGPKPTLTEGSPEEDAAADRNAGMAVLYKVSDAMGHMDLSEVARSCPFNQSLLCPDDCFVLDTGARGKIYVWKGRKANEQERQAALSVAEQTITRMGYSPHTQVEILPQGRETPLFKQFFSGWK
ncbi:macrophage-capping protein isoform X3 [Phasianus colchicus]|uniref:macrophage-capping protein isoform X3 n=1 Tax=Phasianus colchicus TaxID=9054 RepID=UPI00129E5913|nr:macrophage-capping protein isoform X3 [Phasianus colchicus]